MKQAFLVLFNLLIVICSQAQEISGIELETIDGQKIIPKEDIAKQKATVFVFYSPECPLTQNYTLTINGFTEEYTKEDIKFYVVISGEDFSEKEIKLFASTYKLQQQILLDPDYKLAKALDAKVTPEVFLLNPKQELLYRGAIDNWAIKLGSKRVKITEFYFRDAVESFLKGEAIDVAYQKAVGCFIF